MQLWRFAKQHRHGQINRLILKQGILNDQMRRLDRPPDNRNRTAFPLAQKQELFELLGADRQDISLLRFVTPEL